jgi:hypothetical protein
VGATHRTKESRILKPMSGDQALEDFQNFTHSVSAARLLMSRAHENDSLIEGLVLYASIIDAFLRILIAHATGERDGTVTQLDLRYFRHDDTLWMNERKVYRRAHTCGVLSESERHDLDELYDFRNVVIHRFIISGITYDQIGPRLDQYEAIFTRLRAQLEHIEQPAPALSDAETAAVRARIARKLGNPARDVRRPH